MADRSAQRRMVWWITLLPISLAGIVALTGFAAVPLAWAMRGIEWALLWLLRVIVTLAMLAGLL